MTKEAAIVALTIGLLTALTAIFFTFVLPRLIDYSIDRNTKILKDLIEIRKSVDDGTPDAIELDVIIEYRRNKHVSQQQKEYAISKNANEIQTLEKELKKKKNIEKELDKPWYKLAHSALFGIAIVFVSCVLVAYGGANAIAGWIFH